MVTQIIRGTAGGMVAMDQATPIPAPHHFKTILPSHMPMMPKPIIGR